MNEQIFTQLVCGIIAILGALISAYLIPWLKAKVDTTKMADFISFVENVVRWANQTIPPEEWERKKEEVTQRVISYVERHSGLELTDDDIDAIIEAVVNSVKMKG